MTGQYYWSQSNFYFIFIFFQNTVVSIQLGKRPTLGSCTKIYHYTAHTWTRTTILACWQSSSLIKSMFSHLFRWITRIIGTIYHKYSIFLSPTKGIPQIFTIFEPCPTYLTSFLVKTSQIPRIFGIGHQHYSNFSNDTEYTLQLQASTQLTMLRMVLDHNPNAFMTVQHSCKHRWIANTHYYLF